MGTKKALLTGIGNRLSFMEFSRLRAETISPVEKNCQEKMLTILIDQKHKSDMAKRLWFMFCTKLGADLVQTYCNLMK